MFVPFGTHVADRNGKTVGTVSRLVLHLQTREVVALVVQQGVLDRCEVMIPLNKVGAFGDEVRLVLSAAELAGVDLYDSHPLRPMPDHWPMPAGFALRSEHRLAGGTAATPPPDARAPFPQSRTQPRSTLRVIGPAARVT